MLCNELNTLILHPQKLVKKLISNIKIKNIKFRDLIRSFSEKITSIRQLLLQNIDINDWINNTVTETEIKLVIENVRKKLK